MGGCVVLVEWYVGVFWVVVFGGCGWVGLVGGGGGGVGF